jgi:hypothetical protein
VVDLSLFHKNAELLRQIRPRPIPEASVPIYCLLTLSLLMSYIYGAPSKARNLTSYIYERDFYWGFCFLNRAFS